MILVISKNGEYELTNHDLTNHYDPTQVLSAEKFNPDRVVSVVHWDAANNAHYVKRFHIETTSMDKKFLFINEGRANKLLIATTHGKPEVRMTYKERNKEAVDELLDLNSIIDVKGWKANGNKVSTVKTARFELKQTKDPFVEKKKEEAVEDPEDSHGGNSQNGGEVSKAQAEKIPLEKPAKSGPPEVEPKPEKESPPKTQPKKNVEVKSEEEIKPKAKPKKKGKNAPNDQDSFTAGDQLNLL
jgi:topoisomerase-4 subunit A